MFNKLKNAINSISPISEEDWLMLEPQLNLREYKKNDYYLSAGETENQISFIYEGSFKWYYINSKGEEMNFHFFFDNNFVVEFNSFILQKQSQMFIQAMEDSQVILLPKREKILELYASSHNWERFGRIISETHYTNSSQRVQDFLFRSAEERYLNLIKGHPYIFQRVSLSNISSYLGMQGPSLSRIRRRISKQ
jgi:CRP/FNR family transcriptional regulator, anaerobic regulatory protein